MSLVFRSLIVSDAHVALARTLAATLAGPAGSGMWTTPLSADGHEPATHWISTGWIEDSFANLMPLTVWIQLEDEWRLEYEVPGQPELVVQLSAEAGVTISLDDVAALFAESDITEQEWPITCERLGLNLTQLNTTL